jgi:hypothetical protein
MTLGQVASATTGRIDPDRLRRALALNVTRLPSGDYTVGDYDVSPTWGCTCPDHRIRRVECKHLLAIRLARLDPDIRAALKEVAA